MLLLVLLVALVFVLAPTWPYSRRWGYYPSGALGVVLLAVAAWFMMGRLQ